MLYPAFIETDTDGTASGWFPDVAGCIFAGDTIEDAFTDAKSAINAHFELLSEKNADIPLSHAIDEHLAKNSDEYIGGQWIYVDVDMDQFDGHAERINITLPHRLLTRIDSLVNQHKDYGSRSAFLASAARNELKKAV
ncbi:MAG: type II toxin-antitoxin system HicB family antitoxin [Enterobacteriaceae bacterium]|jgi:predicted RNase H-like HicB family nuclease|nr:type II toxin-antitoxin system HicB family antitoxin [Enterobacteriaceae bacterium]